MPKKSKGSYRFFYHYYKQKKAMTVHYRGTCYVTSNVDCRVACETHWNKSQPQLVMRGFSKNIEVLEDKIIIH
jgi:hypothetical protein